MPGSPLLELKPRSHAVLALVVLQLPPVPRCWSFCGKKEEDDEEGGGVGSGNLSDGATAEKILLGVPGVLGVCGTKEAAGVPGVGGQNRRGLLRPASEAAFDDGWKVGEAMALRDVAEPGVGGKAPPLALALPLPLRTRDRKPDVTGDANRDGDARAGDGSGEVGVGGTEVGIWYGLRTTTRVMCMAFLANLLDV